MSFRSLAALFSFASLTVFGGLAHAEEGLSSEAVPVQESVIPARPRPLLEIGEPFLASGPLGRGWRLPTGATWRPALLLFGTFRTAVQTLDQGVGVTEWANRLDLKLNLRLSGTERLFVGLRPLDGGGRFSGYRGDGPDDGWSEEGNLRIDSAFFEGDLGEIFPSLDRNDRRALDLGFSIGRQPLSAQDGFLLNDTIDSVGFTKNSLRPGRSSNVRITGLAGWGDVDRRPGASIAREDRSASLLWLSTGIDLVRTTLDIDVVHVGADRDRGDGIFAGLGATQRLGRLSATFRLLASVPLHDETSEMGRGQLVVAELSWAPRGTHDVIYVNSFLARGEFSSAARDPLQGGPLSRIGLLFEAPALAPLHAPLGDRAIEAAGLAMGRQWILAEGRRQVVLEAAARQDRSSDSRDEAGFGLRFQQALGQRTILQVDGFAVGRERLASSYGLRTEVILRF